MPKITKTVRGQSVFPKSLLPRTRRMQFRKPCLNFYSKKLKSFCSISTVQGRKKNKKKRIPLNSISWHVNWFSGTMPRSFHRKAKMFHLNVPRQQKQFEEKKFFQSHCSPGHVGCSFENPAKIFTQKGWEFLAQYQQFMGEKWQKTTFLGLVFLKLRLQFWQPCRKVSAKRPHCFSSVSEGSIENQLKNVFSNSLFLWTRTMQL